jgi:hypothetical protein
VRLCRFGGGAEGVHFLRHPRLPAPSGPRVSRLRGFTPPLLLKRGLFFDRETFGADRLVVGAARSRAPSPCAMPRSRRQGPVARIYQAKRDYLPGLSSDEKKARLRIAIIALVGTGYASGNC